MASATPSLQQSQANQMPRVVKPSIQAPTMNGLRLFKHMAGLTLSRRETQYTLNTPPAPTWPRKTSSPSRDSGTSTTLTPRFLLMEFMALRLPTPCTTHHAAVSPKLKRIRSHGTLRSFCRWSSRSKEPNSPRTSVSLVLRSISKSSANKKATPSLKRSCKNNQARD
jgi:hypothetical protein